MRQMPLQRFPRPDTFLAEVEPDLSGDEAANSLLLGLTRSLVSFPPDRPPLLAGLRTDGHLLAAFMTPPHPLVLASAPADTPRSIDSLANTLLEESLPVSGVSARPRLADAFSMEWSRLTGASTRWAMHQRLYRLTTVADVPTASGRLRRADLLEVDLIGRWIEAFNRDIGDPVDTDRALANARVRIERGEIYLWEDGEARSMAGSSRPTRNSITVNAVYTPPEWRGRGYATAAVAALSSELLAQGYGMCVLYTDLANPTSNRIYQRIGYEPVCDSVHLRFAES